MTATLPALDSTAVALCNAIDAGDRLALGMLADHMLHRMDPLGPGLAALRDQGKWPNGERSRHSFLFNGEGESVLPDEWFYRCPSHIPDGKPWHQSASAAILEAAAAYVEE